MATATVNRIFKVERQKVNVSRQAEQYLGVCGVTRLLPDLWDAVMFEMATAGQTGLEWTYRRLAYRYLSLLRDRVGASSIRNERLGD